MLTRSLWAHNEAALAALRDTVRQRVTRIVVSGPTGSGKTHLAAGIFDSALSKKKRVAFVVSSLGLIDQTVEAFYAEGVRDIGVIQADHGMTDWAKPLQVCSVQTLRSRKVFPEADVVVIDECHEVHQAHRNWILAHPELVFIGLSATPYTRGLGLLFETMITVATTQEMIDKGILCDFRVFAVSHPDLSGVGTVAGDYKEGELSDAMQKDDLSGDIVHTWETRWGKGKTLVFGVDCAHAQSLQERFKQAGHKAGYQDAQTCGGDRRDLKRAFHNGDLDLVCNVGTLVAGVDWDVRCISLCRPTKSEILYKQIVGRALRKADGKPWATILDHSNTTGELGFVTDIEHDHLDTTKPGERLPPKESPKKKLKECHGCAALYSGSRICPYCGFENKPQCGIYEDDSVELQEIKRGAIPLKKKKQDRTYTLAEKAQFLAELKAYGITHGYKPGWAANKYREKFEVWPAWDIEHTPPAKYASAATTMWIKAGAVKWAKSQARKGTND